MNISEVQNKVSGLISTKEPKKFLCGKLENSISITEFENMFNAKIDYTTSKSNEYDTLDVKANIANTNIKMSIEIKENKVTHINDVDEF